MTPDDRNRLNVRLSRFALILSAGVAVLAAITQALRDGG